MIERPLYINQQSIIDSSQSAVNDPQAAQAALPVMEAFYTLQGEGFHQGKAAYFIRLGGCDVGCFWCDVKESWDAALHPQRSILQITEQAKKEINQRSTDGHQPIIVITGGEPLIHNLDALTLHLQEENFRTHV